MCVCARGKQKTARTSTTLAHIRAEYVLYSMCALLYAFTSACAVYIARRVCALSLAQVVVWRRNGTHTFDVACKKREIYFMHTLIIVCRIKAGFLCAISDAISARLLLLRVISSEQKQIII